MAKFIRRGGTLYKINEDGPPTLAAEKPVKGDQIISGNRVLQVQASGPVPISRCRRGSYLRGKRSPELNCDPS